MSVYLRLFHGRIHPDDHPEDWGIDGPVFGPLQYAHTTYAAYIHLANADKELGDLTIANGDMVYYNGHWYGDWSVFDETVLGKYVPEAFDADKADRERLYYVESAELDNPIVRCPKCGYQAGLMDGFSLLAAGFNGIKAGDADDLDLQECGNCQAKLKWY